MSDVGEVVHHGESLKGLARALLGDEHDVEDVVQDAWVRALEVRPDRPRDLLAWLRGTVRNLSLSNRRVAADRRIRLGSGRGRDRAEQAEATDETALRSEASMLITRAVHDLPAQYREVVVLRYWDNLTPQAIAARLGVPTKTVRSSTPPATKSSAACTAIANAHARARTRTASRPSRSSSRASMKSSRRCVSKRTPSWPRSKSYEAKRPESDPPRGSRGGLRSQVAALPSRR